MSGHPRPTFTIVSQEPAPRFLGLAASERNRRVAIRAGASLAASDDRPVLEVPATAAITAELVAALPTPDRTWHVIWHDSQPPLVWRPAPSASIETTAPSVCHVPNGLVFDVSTAAARHRASWVLLRRSGKPRDGWLSRHVHRKVSRLFSYMFMLLGLSANAATIFALLIGLAAAYCMAQTSHATMIAGGLLYWCASIADGIDGEIARLTLSESAFGEQLDTGVDQLTHFAGLAGVVTGWWRQGIGPAGMLLAIVVLLGTPAVLVWAMAVVRRARGASQFFVPTKPIETAIFSAVETTNALPLRIAAVVFVLFRREAFSFSFFLVSLATSQRVAIPFLIAVGLGIVGLTLTLYRSVLDRELRREFGTA